MPDRLTITIADAELQLFACGGAYWPQRDALFMADTHFGKESTFRRHGIPVPVGSTDSTLEKIDSLLNQTGAKKLFILGDMFHSRSSLSVDVCDSLTMFFDDYPEVTFTLIRGNHDQSTGKLPDQWPIETVQPGFRMGDIALGHDPNDDFGKAKSMLCGHIHPSVYIGHRSDRIKCSCFWLHDRRLVFPAIGQFTGTHVVKPVGDDRVWALADSEIFPYAHRQNTASS